MRVGGDLELVLVLGSIVSGSLVEVRLVVFVDFVVLHLLQFLLLVRVVGFVGSVGLLSFLLS